MEYPEKPQQVSFAPRIYRSLIEAVYSGGETEIDEGMVKALSELIKKESEARDGAEQCLLPKPDPEDSFSGPASMLEFMESETESSWVIAQTRLGEESLTIIPLELDRRI